MSTIDTAPTEHAEPGTRFLPLRLDGFDERTCTRCGDLHTATTWRLTNGINDDEPVCLACGLADPELRPYAMFCMAADQIDATYRSTPTPEMRQALADLLHDAVGHFANWRHPDETDHVTPRPFENEGW